ncbi:MAG: type III pantothenate kinase [Bacteroides sp.]|nr:type III pantothenate kinase [Bacteroides sp.]
MNLVIDVGNTAVKAAVFNGKELINVVSEPDDSFDFLNVICLKYEITAAIIASTRNLTDESVQILNVKLPFLHWLNETSRLPIVNLYETPQSLGNDRIAAVVGANEQFPGKDILVIDAGTAITYDFIDSQAHYHGGNISPGISMRFKALHQYTSRLPLITQEGRLPDLGKDTETAIRAGVLKGIEYEIMGYITLLKDKYPELLVFLTGGNGISFDTNIKNIIFADRFLVLKGLNRILNYN